MTVSKHSQSESGLTLPNVQQRTPDDGRRGCPKHAEFHDRINLDN